MKKLLTLLTVILGFAIGAWADDTSTLTFTSACGGTGTADDGVVWTVTSDGDESTFDNTKGIHYGTGSKAVKYIKLSTSDITGTITSVKVNASTANGVSATVDVTIGGEAFGGDAQSLTNSAADYTFNGSATGEIVVTVTKPESATKALYVKSIEVTYTPAGGGSETTYGIVGDLTGGWEADKTMTKSADNENVYTLTIEGVEISEIKAYEYKLRANKTFENSYQLPANGNQSWTPEAVGVYTLTFTANISENTLNLAAEKTADITIIANTQETAFTVAEALEKIADTDAAVLAKDYNKVYVKGTVKSITTLNPEKYKNATYIITDDGENELTIYRGYYLNGADFTSTDQLAVDDAVIIFGNLLNYNGTKPEINEGNYLVSIERPASYGIVGDLTGGWDSDATMTSEDGKTYTVTVEGVEIPEIKAYEYKLRANKTWTDSYQIPAKGNKTWTPEEIGVYTLTFTANIEENTLDITAATKTGELTIIANTAETALSVEAAITLTNETDAAVLAKTYNKMYVKGTVTDVGNLNNGNLTYYLTDGTNKLQIYSGKYLEGADFDADKVAEIEGKIAVVYGNLKIYNDAPEMDKNNVLISLEDAPVVIENMYLVGDFTGGFPGEGEITWDAAVAMTQDKDNANIWTYEIKGFEAEAKTYNYKVSANKNWDGYKLPDNGNKTETFETAGKYDLLFTVDTENHSLTLTATKVEEQETEPVYTLVGAYRVGEENKFPSNLFWGAGWDVTKEENNMVKGDDGIYTIKFENVEFTELGTIQYKVVKNHAYTNGQWGFGENNADYNITKTGKYNVTFKFNPDATFENGYNVDCVVEEIQEPEPVEGIIPDGTYYVRSASEGVLINASGALDAKGAPITFTFDATTETYTIAGAEYFAGKQWTIAEAFEGMSGYYTFSTGTGEDKTFLAVGDSKELAQIADGTAENAVWILLKKDYWEDIALSTYTIIGTKDLTGTEEDWAVSDDNKMTYNEKTELFEITYKNIAVDNEHQPSFKVFKENAQGEKSWYPATEGNNDNNWVITTDYVGGEGVYDITITFDPSDFKEIGVSAKQNTTFDFAAEDFRENIGEAMTDTKGYIYNETFTADGATLQITAGSAPSRIYVDGSRGQNLVTYKEYTTLTFKAPEGKAITKIEFTAAGNSNIKNFTASSGAIDGMVWTGNADGVRFAQGGTSYLANAIVSLEKATTATTALPAIEYTKCENIAAFNKLEAGTYAELTLTDAEVIGKSADGYSTVFIQDATGGAWIQYTSLNDKLQEKTKMNGTIYAIKRAIYPGGSHIKEAEATIKSEFTAEAIDAYTTVEGTIAEVNVAANLNKVVKISGAKLEMTSPSAGTLTLGETTIPVNNGSAAVQQLQKIADWEKGKILENVTITAILVAKSATVNELYPISIEQPVEIKSMAIVGDFLGLEATETDEKPNWNPANGWKMTQDEGNPSIWTLTVEGFEAEAKTYYYKAVANGNWNDYVLPNGDNQDYNFDTADLGAGKYNLTFTANTEQHTLALVAEKVVEPEPEAVYTLVGSFTKWNVEENKAGEEIAIEGLFASIWDAENAENPNTMELNEETGKYTLSFTNIELPAAGNINYKVVKNHSWTENWGTNDGGNCYYWIGEAGKYSITFTFDLNADITAGAWYVSCEATKTGDATGIASIKAAQENGAAIYTLQGVRVNNVKKGGMYIVNGKKIAVK